MEFVETTGSPYYYCFLTKKREYEFPTLVPTMQLGMPVFKTSKQTHAARLHQRFAALELRRCQCATRFGARQVGASTGHGGAVLAVIDGEQFARGGSVATDPHQVRGPASVY